MRYLLLTVLAFVFVKSHGQQPIPHKCGYDHYVHLLNELYPGFKATIDKTFAENKSSTSRSSDVHTVPVVVHIVWQDSSQNLSNAVVEEVIASLNADYRRLNADANLIRDTFLNVVGDAMIEFELIAIERVETDATFELDFFSGTLPDNVKQTSEGGSDAWDTERYLNIWVCTIEGGALLGYAYPPAGLDHWPAGSEAPESGLDGVVIHTPVFKASGDYISVGLGGGMDTIPVRGRTITHEVGHYLGLRHIWGDGLLSIIGIPDCDADDGVEDTPNQGLSSQQVCDPTLNTCSDTGGIEYPDMIENYMDYSTETCQNSFTHQQIAIMRSVLENERYGLIDPAAGNQGQSPVKNLFDIYPNPADDYINITFSDKSDYGVELRIIDMLGKTHIVQFFENGVQQFNINIGSLNPGMYSMVVFSGNKYGMQQLIVE